MGGSAWCETWMVGFLSTWPPFLERSDAFAFALSLTLPFPFSFVGILGDSSMLLIDAVCISSSYCAGVISGWMFLRKSEPSR